MVCQNVCVCRQPLPTPDDLYVEFNGLADYILHMADADMSAASRRWAEQFSYETTCPHCHGARLNKEALSFLFAGKNIYELASMEMGALYEWLDGVEERVDSRSRAIASEILKEIRTRLKFLLDVGLEYLSLSRSTMTLSGGEPAHSSCHANRFAARQCALHPRRAEHRASSARQRASH